MLMLFRKGYFHKKNLFKVATKKTLFTNGWKEGQTDEVNS